MVLLQPEVLYGLGIALLGVAIAWGIHRSSQRNPTNDRVTAQATKELYEDPAHYPQKREELKQQVRPS